MADSEIVKALECCTAKPRALCKECPYFLGNGKCKLEALQRDSLALINRQQAEIGRYKAAMPCIEYQDNEFCGVLCGFAEDIINRKNAEIERWQDLMKEVVAGRHSPVKAKTIKEFAERLIGKAKSTKERFLLESLVESVMKEMGVMACD